ncbi:hypothetical protein CF327_g1059 [Tilletia walkeri]|uniref:Uncharacterized protein n=1 Tax=Tilletia walkeri TaxID=117179 RepID=A0A8X7NFE8_9BASI|nr:hypothetical protein CF327_g1059 [Tilletia walkeri]KAE8271430.1 hypothetical protein A4X09_0g898 [Tilletia walkeri]
MTRALPAPLQILIERKSVPLCLPPGSPCYDPTISTQIDRFASSSDRLRAALHLLNDDVARAHAIAQLHEDEMTCNLVHCILHRREQDFSNSNWWCRKIDHPLLKIIHGGSTLAEAQNRACRFTDDCQAATRGASTVCGAKKLQELKKLQRDEMVTLVQWLLEQES